MKTILAKVDFLKLFAGCLIIRLVFAGASVTPRPFEIVAGIYAVLILYKVIKTCFEKLQNELTRRWINKIWFRFAGSNLIRKKQQSQPD